MKTSKAIKGLLGRLTIDDLPNHLPSSVQLRGKAKILIIDDQSITHEAALRSMGYNIKIQKQWNDIKDVEPYQVIISDNHGVTNNIGASCDGTAMMIQARNTYPEKEYVVYSANIIDMRDRNISGFELLTKGDQIDDWTSLLDDAIKKCFDPRLSWYTISSFLQNQNLTEKELRVLQNNYVKSILSENTDILSNREWSFDRDTLSVIIRLATLAVNAMKLLSSSL